MIENEGLSKIILGIKNLSNLISLNLELYRNEIISKGFDEIFDKLNEIEENLQVYCDIRNNNVEN